jgi:peroxiredoxin
MPWLDPSPKRAAPAAASLLLALTVVCFVGCGRSKSGGGSSSGDASAPPAADFALKDLSGKTVTLADLKGKAVLIDFWATWCGPCEESIPYWEKIHQKYGSDRFTVIGVDEDAETNVVAPFVKSHKMAYPILLDPDNRAYDAYGVRGLPTLYLIDADGKLRNQWVGFSDDVASEVEKAVTALAAPKKT